MKPRYKPRPRCAKHPGEWALTGCRGCRRRQGFTRHLPGDPCEVVTHAPVFYLGELGRARELLDSMACDGAERTTGWGIGTFRGKAGAIQRPVWVERLRFEDQKALDAYEERMAEDTPERRTLAALLALAGPLRHKFRTTPRPQDLEEAA